MVVDGKRARRSMSVGANCILALTRLFQHESDSLVWIDAICRNGSREFKFTISKNIKQGEFFGVVGTICINQKNDNERNQQVSLMAQIYRKAESVSIWLGPEMDESQLAIRFLQDVADSGTESAEISKLMASEAAKAAIPAVVDLFERAYWKRLWVVQEVHNAWAIEVYCGMTKLPWSTYEKASNIFRQHRHTLDKHFAAGFSDGKRYAVSRGQLSYSSVLAYQGPRSLFATYSEHHLDAQLLLELLRNFRSKLAADPRDKVFALLGILPDSVRMDFKADYNLSIKQVYTKVVEYIIRVTGRLDVICETIHYPLKVTSIDLPTFVPDWSYISQQASLAFSHGFDASRFRLQLPGPSKPTMAQGRFIDGLLNKLAISAIRLDTIEVHGVSVGTLCGTADFLMAFLQWRALLLKHIDKKFEMEAEERNENHEFDKIELEDEFCQTICLGQVPSKWLLSWREVVYNLFASLLNSRLAHLQLDAELDEFREWTGGIETREQRSFLRDRFGRRMMGQCFFLTKSGLLGMGSGFLGPNDLVVLPPGCSTPIIVRKQGNNGEYRFVGDAYIHGYMNGEYIDEWLTGAKGIENFVLH
jgi:hypothetical protein